MPCSSLVVHVHIYHLNQEGRKSRVHKTIGTKNIQLKQKQWSLILNTVEPHPIPVKLEVVKLKAGE